MSFLLGFRQVRTASFEKCILAVLVFYEQLLLESLPTEKHGQYT